MPRTLKNLSLIQSVQGNHYVYDKQKKGIFLCHPRLYGHIANVLTGDNTSAAIPVTDDDYYYRKYQYLKNHGYFDHAIEPDSVDVRLTPQDVETQLANLRQVTFEITDCCSMNCKYCGYGDFYNDYDRRENKMLSVTAAKNLLLRLSGLWKSSLNLSSEQNVYISFYGGEPLLNTAFIREIADFTQTLDAPNRRFTFSMTTNALLLEKYMDYLVEKDFRLLISLDGDEANTAYRVLHDNTPAYPHILRNVEALRNKYPEYFKTNVNFNAVFHNKNSVSQIYRFFKETFDKIPSIGELNTSGIREDKKEEFWSAYANVSQNLMQSEDYSFIEREMFINLPSIQSMTMFLDKYGANNFRAYPELIAAVSTPGNREKVPAQRTPTGSCYPFAKRLFVTVNGKLLPCERISQHFSLGHVDDHAVTLNYQAIADMYNRYFDKVRKMCGQCYNLDACSQCIFNMDLEQKNPSCGGFMNSELFSRSFFQFISALEKTPETYSRIKKEVFID